MKRSALLPLLLLKWLLGAALLLVLLSLLALGWLLLTSSGARLVAELGSGLSGGKLSLTGVNGRLIGPLQLQGLTWDDGHHRYTLDQATLDWEPSRLLGGELRIRSLQAGQLELLGRGTAPQPTEATPVKLPTHLPLAVVLQSASLDQLRVLTADGGKPLQLDALALSASWRGTQLEIEQAIVQLAAVGTLRASGSAQLQPQAIDIQRLTVDGPARLELSGLAALAGASHLSARWQDARWPLSGDALVHSPEGQLQLDGDLARAELSLTASLSAGAQLQGKAHWDGSSDGSSDGSIDATLGWTGLGWPLTVSNPEIASSAGQLRLQGKPEDWRAQLDGALRVAHGERSVDGSVQAQLSGDLHQAQLQRLQLDVLGGRLDASGQVAWSSRSSPAGAELSGTLANIDPGAVYDGLQATLNGNFSARTTFSAPLTAQLHLQLANSRWRGRTLQLLLDGDAREGVMQLRKAELRSGASHLAASGRAWPDFDLQLALDSPSLADFAPQLSGRLNATAQLHGTPQRPQLKLDGSGAQLLAGTLRAGQLTVHAELDPAGPLQLKLNASEVHAGIALDTLNLQLDGSAARHRLQLATRAPTLNTDLAAEGGLDLAARRWAGRLTQADLTPLHSPTWQLEAAAAVLAEPARQRLERACLRSEAGRLCVAVEASEGRTQAQLTADAVDLGLLQAVLPEGWTLDSQLDGRASVALAGSALERVDVQLTAAPGHLADRRDRRIGFGSTTLQVQGTGGALQARLDLPLDTGRVQADATLANAAQWAQRPLSGTVMVGIEQLDWLAYLNREIVRSQGQLDARLQLGGRLGSPQVLGYAKLVNGAVRLRTPGIDVEDVQLRAEAVQGRILLTGSAESGDGQLKLDGSAAADSGIQLNITGERFLAADLQVAQVRISPDLKLSLTDEALRLTGELAVPEALIRPAGFDQGVAPNADQVIVGSEAVPPGLASRLQADVRVLLGEKVHLTGYGLDADLSGAVDVHEQSGRPTSGRGEIRLLNGRYEAYGQKLEIETGRLLFDGGAVDRPAIEVRAIRKPREDISVGVRVRGRLDTPEFTLFSEPSMPQQEQLSWLLLGRPLENAGSSSDRSMVASAALSLGLGGSNRLVQNLKGGLRVDDISIGAEPGEDADTAMFTVGKYLSPSLYIAYGVGLFQPGYQLRLLYDLGRGFKLSTESGVDTGGDLLYSIERP